MILALLGLACWMPRSFQDATDDEIAAFVDQLGADFEDERTAAHEALKKLGLKAETRLAEGLQRPDHRIRKGCLDLLRDAKSVKAVDAAIALFRSAREERTVRQSAFGYLRVTGAGAEDVMIEALDSPELGWRKEALAHLEEIKSQKCAEKVAALYDREANEELKKKAFKVLTALGAAARPHLLKLLSSKDPAVRREAIMGLTSLDPSSKEVLEPVGKLFLSETATDAIEVAYRLLEKAGPAAEATFIEGLKAAHETARLQSIAGLTKLRSERALEPMAALFEATAQDNIREQARLFLVLFGLRAEEPLLRALGSASAKVKLASMQALAEIRSEKPYERIAEIFRTEKDATVHRKAFDYLKVIGARAERELMVALDDASPDIRREAVTALGEARCEAAIPALLARLTDTTAGISEAALGALVRIGPRALAAVEGAAESGKLPKKAADSVRALYHQEEVERLLDRLVTKLAGTGHYEGQFAELEKFGREKALPVLVRIATSPDHKFRVALRPGLELQHVTAMKKLAFLSLGTLGDKGTLATLREFLAARGNTLPHEEGEDAILVLHRLGDSGALKAYLEKLGKSAEDDLKSEGGARQAAEKLFSIALMQGRAGETNASLETNLRLVKLLEAHKLFMPDERYPEALYNVACLYVKKGDLDKALAHLEKAVDAGFKDLEWIRMDRDLDGLRAHEGYRKLVADAKRFEP